MRLFGVHIFIFIYLYIYIYLYIFIYLVFIYFTYKNKLHNCHFENKNFIYIYNFLNNLICRTRLTLLIHQFNIKFF